MARLKIPSNLNPVLVNTTRAFENNTIIENAIENATSGTNLTTTQAAKVLGLTTLFSVAADAVINGN